MSVGEGWELRCSACDHVGTTGPRGACGRCGQRAPVPGLLRLEDRVPARLRSWIPWARRVSRWPRERPWTFLAFWGGLLLGGSPLSPGFLLSVALAAMLEPEGPRGGPPPRLVRQPVPPDLPLPEGARPRPRETWLHHPEAELRRSWWSLSRLGARRGLVAAMDLRLRGLQGRVLDLSMRVEGPDGRWIRGPLPQYRGPRGEARALHRLPPLRHDDARFPDLWIFLPVRSLGLPTGLRRAELLLEVRLSDQGQPVLVHHLPVDFVPVPEDLWEAPGLESAARSGLFLLETTHEGPATCGVCGEADAAVRRACPDCGAKHHRECWDYLGGCSRFACSRAPRASP